MRERRASLSGSSERRRQRAASVIVEGGEFLSGSVIFVNRGGLLREGAPLSGSVFVKGGSLRGGGAASPLRGCIRGRREVKVEGGTMSSNGAKASKSQQKPANGTIG